MAKTCYDCKHCAPRDVFKGFCEVNFEAVVVDQDKSNCDGFEPRAKCKNCANYTPEEEYLGKCMSKFVAYPDLLACENYKAL